MMERPDATKMLDELRLYGIKESLEHRLGEAENASLTYVEFLDLILEDEKLYRQNRKCVMLKKRAKFRDNAYLENFEVTDDRGVSKTLLRGLKSLYFITSRENIILVGGTGAGKSFLAQAIGHEVCSSGVEVFFISVNRLFKEIEVADAQGNYLTYLNRLKNRVSVLILDDFGLRNYSHKEANVLYEILEDRYSKGPVIVTSQVDPRGWNGLIEDQVISEAIMDRLVANARVIEIKGPSYRGRNQRRQIDAVQE